MPSLYSSAVALLSAQVLQRSAPLRMVVKDAFGAKCVWEAHTHISCRSDIPKGIPGVIPAPSASLRRSGAGLGVRTAHARVPSCLISPHRSSRSFVYFRFIQWAFTTPGEAIAVGSRASSPIPWAMPRRIGRSRTPLTVPRRGPVPLAAMLHQIVMLSDATAKDVRLPARRTRPPSQPRTVRRTAATRGRGSAACVSRRNG